MKTLAHVVLAYLRFFTAMGLILCTGRLLGGTWPNQKMLPVFMVICAFYGVFEVGLIHAKLSRKLTKLKGEDMEELITLDALFHALAGLDSDSTHHLLVAALTKVCPQGFSEAELRDIAGAVTGPATTSDAERLLRSLGIPH